MQNDVLFLQKFYHGFLITRPEGNNAFSFEQRVNKTIYVPPICSGTAENLNIGKQIVFSEIEDWREFNKLGLECYIAFQWRAKPVFIFDNHNHAFFFWLFGLNRQYFSKGLALVHVDQHTDMRTPEQLPEFSLTEGAMLPKAFRYTNFMLNVGNFIQPALHLKVFSRVHLITGSQDFKEEFTAPFVFDLDMDVFAPEMDYIDNEYKIQRIRHWLNQAVFVTVATSPYFMDQTLAIRLIKRIFEL